MLPLPPVDSEEDVRRLLHLIGGFLRTASAERARDFRYRAVGGDYQTADGEVCGAVLMVLAIRDWDRRQNRSGRWFTVRSGWRFFPEDPRPEDVNPADVAYMLARQPRFNGALDSDSDGASYSVAQHSVLLSRYAPPRLALLALLHDAPEAYLADVPSPVKALLGQSYSRLERLAWDAVSRAFSVGDTGDDWLALKKWDQAILHAEARDFFPLGYVTDGVNWGGEAVPGLDILRQEGIWGPEEAERKFLRRLAELRPAP